ncbi:MAG: addiction module toxin RelE [Deltaproteobacteria bacterium]|nr:addiction module toxin RelE [Deltaproteobacteria bacterium]
MTLVLKRAFAEPVTFQKDWASAGLTDGDLRELQTTILLDPDAGDLIAGTGGLRKIRVGAKGKGKRGGGRVIYKDFPRYGWTVFLYLYLKNDKTDLSAAEKQTIRDALPKLEEAIRALYIGRER